MTNETAQALMLAVLVSTTRSTEEETNASQQFDVDEQYIAKLMETLITIEYIVCPTLVVIGLVGNTLTILTVSHSQFRRVATRYVLCALAISDSLLLCTNPFNQSFMMNIWDRDVRALSEAGCKFFFVMYRTGKLSASWCIVLIAVERFCAIMFPLKVKCIISKRKILVSLAAAYAVVLTLSAIWSFSTGIEGGICRPDLVDESNERFHKSFVIVGACVYSIIPISILLILTPPVVVKLIKSHRERKKTVRGKIERSARVTSKVSIMLIAVTLEYAILVTPITVFLVCTYWTAQPIFGSSNPDRIVLQALALICEQLNHSINFFVYVLCSSQFRHRCRDMLLCRKQSKPELARIMSAFASMSRTSDTNV